MKNKKRCCCRRGLLQFWPCWTVHNTENELRRFLCSSLPASIKQHSLVNCLNVIRSVADCHYIFQAFCPDGCYCAKSSHRPFNKDVCFRVCIKFSNSIQLLCEAQKRCVCITSSRVRAAEDIDIVWKEKHTRTHTHTSDLTHTDTGFYLSAHTWTVPEGSRRANIPAKDALPPTCPLLESPSLFLSLTHTHRHQEAHNTSQLLHSCQSLCQRIQPSHQDKMLAGNVSASHWYIHICTCHWPMCLWDNFQLCLWWPKYDFFLTLTKTIWGFNLKIALAQKNPRQ